MRISIDLAVDQLMKECGVAVPEDPVVVFMARVELLEGFEGVRVSEWPLRTAYVHLHETLTDMSAEPILLGSVYARRVGIFLEVVQGIGNPHVAPAHS